jgi:hypothetical protein
MQGLYDLWHFSSLFALASKSMFRFILDSESWQGAPLQQWALASLLAQFVATSGSVAEHSLTVAELGSM